MIPKYIGRKDEREKTYLEATLNIKRENLSVWNKEYECSGVWFILF